MTDYNKLTVANLRQLLKDRGIASTGLTRKAQIIEKLEERDREDNEAPAEAEAEASPEAEPEPEPQPEPAQVEAEREEEPAAQGEAAPTEPVSPEQPAPEAAPQTNVDEAAQPPAPISEEQPERQQTPPQSAPESPKDATEPAQTAQPPPTTDTQDFAMADVRTPSPDPNEKQSVEKVTLQAIPEQEANASVDASRLNTEELEADTRKRKRRSQSPEVMPEQVRAKKARQSDEAAPDVHLKEDQDVVMEQRPAEVAVEQVEKKKGKAKEISSPNTSPATTTGAPSALNVEASPQKEEETVKETEPALEKKEKEARYKDLFRADAEPVTTTEDPSDDRPIFPALHPATPAIYIRDLMRPLRPELLRKHLVTLATPPSAPQDDQIVESLFLDQMKSHAIVLFANTTAATRVRSSLHGAVWPLESQRKELWVDFIPKDKAADWIKEEEDAITAEKESRRSGRSIPTKRFEIVYPETEDGRVEAVFQEVGARAPPNAPRGPRASIDQFRRGSAQGGLAGGPSNLGAPRNEETRKDLGKSFQTLDQLFASTEAKPKLYFLPVSEETATRRREELRYETSRDWNPGEKVRGRGAQYNRLDQKVRFSFDEDDRLIEVGSDFGPWRDDTGFRGGRGGRGGFRGGGGYRGPRGAGIGYRGGSGRLD